MKVNKNKMTADHRKIYDFIESNVSPAHRMEATLFMGHLTYIKQECMKHSSNHCSGCPFYSVDARVCFPNDWDVEQIIKNIFSNLD